MTPAQRLHRANADPIVSADIMLVEFWLKGHPSDKLRVALNNEDVTSNGVVYPYGALDFTFPDTDEAAPSLSVSVSNVNRSAGRVVLAAKNQIIVRIMMVNAEDFDTVILDTKDMLALTDVTVTPERVSGNLQPQLSPLEPTPAKGVDAQFFPGL